ncbi:efflux RND transporter periplasmic adaptor subunit [Aliivibrio fischeri]|uniref:efflux RND transporter periplasmic adaptor subunit n=1 Tax=Aliivibrio fischeri TaxID=668 RepID=UPI00084BDD28|nr:efflux RND transporter periplasmic adaptor subunit [Aliivibrio fischeri]OED57182.1 efflux transporter periplasmic adaptor subunit [Aliivibrio fischeri]
MKSKTLLASIISAALLVGCSDESTAQRVPQAPLVGTYTVEPISYQQGKTYIGRIEAMEDASISAQVSGYIQSRQFKEGQMVEKGDVLFQIDPSSFEAQVANAKAGITQANAALKKAQLDFNRGKNLLPKGNISQAEFDGLTAQLLSAEAQVEAAQAQLKLAQVNLSYTTITAPFTGRISDSKASIGDLVSPASGVLTTLVSLDPIHTRFTISERERLMMGIDAIEGDGKGASSQVEVVLNLENGKEYKHLGKVDFIGNRIDKTTGTLTLRALVDNPEHTLLPGQHINVNLREKQPTEVLVAPRRAVQSDLEGDFVMVLTEGNIAGRRNVTLGKQLPEGVIISSGIKANEQVLVKGLQRVRNGVQVRLENTES